MPEPDPKVQATNGDPAAPQSLRVTIGDEEKTFTAEDITNLIAQQAGATQASQEAAAAIKAAQQFEVPVDQFVSEAKNSFAVIQKLLDDGVIDTNGDPITRSPAAPTPRPAGPQALPLNPQQMSEVKNIGLVMDAIKSIDSKVNKLEESSNHLFRLRLETDLRDKHPEMSTRQISEVIGRAANDPQRRSVWEHGKIMVEELKGQAASTRAHYAKEFGVNLDEFDQNKLNEQDAGGGAGALIKGKKLSFTKKGDGYVHPTQAAASFFGRQGVGKS